MNYKSFLSPKAPCVLPYFGGTRVEAANRRLRVMAPPAEESIGVSPSLVRQRPVASKFSIAKPNGSNGA